MAGQEDAGKCPVQLPSSSADPWGLWVDLGQMGSVKAEEAWLGGHSPQHLVAKGHHGAPDKEEGVRTRQEQLLEGAWRFEQH